MSKTNKKFNTFLFIFRIISIIVIIICLYLLYWWYLDNKQNDFLKQDLNKYIITKNQEPNNVIPPVYTQITDENDISIEQFNVDFDSLIEQNPDCIGWIRIINTNISYPVVQTTDNDYYLTHNIKLNKNGAGWIFADYRNNFTALDQNTIIYGHNRRNGTMFSNLQFYLDEDFCSNPNHSFINFVTPQKKYLAELFSVYKVSSDDVELNNTFETTTKFQETIDTWKAKSIFTFDTEVSQNDKVITLYTCDDDTDYRILLHAKLIPLN